MLQKIYQQILYYQHRLNHPKIQRLSSFTLLSLLTLIFASQISGYMCNYNSDVWYMYFVIVERIAMLLLLIGVFKQIQSKCWVLAELLFAFLIQDIIDRLIFDIKEINLNDYITVVVIITVGIIKYLNKTKT